MADKYIDVSYNMDPVVGTAPRQITATITAISKADGAVITAANDFADGDKVLISGVVGMTEINELGGTVASASATGFTVTEIDSTLFTTYTSGGVASQVQTTPNAVRVIYDDTQPNAEIIQAVRRASEWLAARAGTAGDL